ncbi:MAG: hypothetical protein JWP12_3203 [Bacteroidetes bacterium]|nr:hypothetical protein [Bacteroidota bacterium]
MVQINLLSRFIKFLKRMFGNTTLKGDYDKAKIHTIGMFHDTFKRVLDVFNHPNSRERYKDAAGNLTMDKEAICFDFLPHRICLKYDVSIYASTTVKAYKIEGIEGTFQYKETHLPQLDFSFSTTRNQSGFYEYQFDKLVYCSGNSSEKFFVEYFKTLETTFFPKP